MMGSLDELDLDLDGAGAGWDGTLAFDAGGCLLGGGIGEAVGCLLGGGISEAVGHAGSVATSLDVGSGPQAPDEVALLRQPHTNSSVNT